MQTAAATVYHATMENKPQVAGYRVKHKKSGLFINDHGGTGLPTGATPVSQGEALRRLARYVDAYPQTGPDEFMIEPVYQEKEAPAREAVAADLADRFINVCKKHGYTPLATREQFATIIAGELEDIEEGAGLAALVRSVLCL